MVMIMSEEECGEAASSGTKNPGGGEQDRVIEEQMEAEKEDPLTGGGKGQEPLGGGEHEKALGGVAMEQTDGGLKGQVGCDDEGGEQNRNQDDMEKEEEVQKEKRSSLRDQVLETQRQEKEKKERLNRAWEKQRLQRAKWRAEAKRQAEDDEGEDEVEDENEGEDDGEDVVEVGDNQEEEEKEDHERRGRGKGKEKGKEKKMERWDRKAGGDDSGDQKVTQHHRSQILKPKLAHPIQGLGSKSFPFLLDISGDVSPLF